MLGDTVTGALWSDHSDTPEFGGTMRDEEDPQHDMPSGCYCGGDPFGCDGCAFDDYEMEDNGFGGW